MSGFEHTTEYSKDEFALRYSRDGNVTLVSAQLTDVERVAMQMALGLATDALAAGNPPVGAVLIVNKGEHLFGAKTDDKTSKNLMGHGELRAYNDAHRVIGDDLSESTLVTTAVPCTSCTPHYAEGKIAKIIAAAPRRLIYPLSGLMRPRTINMHDLLADGDTTTTVVLNHQLEKSLALFALYGTEIAHRSPVTSLYPTVS